MHTKYIVWGNEKNITRNGYYRRFFFFSFLCTKRLRRINSTLYQETEQHYHKRVFLVFFTFLGSKKACKVPNMGFPEMCLLRFYERARHQNLKHRTHSIRENKSA